MQLGGVTVIFHPLAHLLVAIYVIGIAITWAVTHVVDGYRSTERGWSAVRGPWDRAWTCVFWPLVLVFQRLLNVVELADWFYDHAVSGLQKIGSTFSKSRKSK